MPEKRSSIVNIAIVGGGAYCTEILEKSTMGTLDARVVAVADADPESPGRKLAERLGVATAADYRELYDPALGVQLIAILTPDPEILTGILESKPTQIRILSFAAYDLFRKAILKGESRLAERNREIEQIFNSIQDFILVMTADRDIVDVNEAFLEKMGYTREEVIGRKCFEVFKRAHSRCSKSDIFCPIHEVKHHGRFTSRVLERKDATGEKRYIELTMFPIMGDDGEVNRFLEVSRDITERKRREEDTTRKLEEMVADRTRQLEETHHRLLHQDKMASLGKLAASMVHEINNPIAGILNLTLLIRRIIGEGQVGEREISKFEGYLKLMEDETRRVSRIVSDLLAFSRPAKKDPKPLDLSRLLEKTLLLSANNLKINNVKVETKIQGGLPEITGTEDHLQQVFMTLIANGAESMTAGGGGTITVRAGREEGEERFTVRFTDEGVGIPEENIGKVFEPFFTTKKNGKGLGLGLSVAYGIIEEYGGTIDVESTVGEGTTFRSGLPLKQLT